MGTTTEYLGLTDQDTGDNENTWGDVADANFAILEQKTSKITPKTITGGTTALTASEAKVAVINLTGTLVSDAIITVADNTKSAWMVNNGTSGDYTVTFKTVSGTGGVIGQGASAFCFSDGTNVTVTVVAFSQLTSMLDVNGFSLGDGTLELMKFSETASAVNEITIANAATGNGPTISATGDDANVDLNLVSKGTGLVKANAKLVGVTHVLSKSANYTVVKADHGALIKCDATSAAFTITLPPAATAGSGFEIVIKKTDASANAITVDGDGSETIDGATTATVSAQYDVLVIRCDGSNWNTVGKIVTATSTPNLGQTTLAKTGAYTVTTSDFGAVVDCDATGGAFTVTLPAAATAGDGFEITVQKTDSGSNAITVDGDGSETIGGATTKELAAQFDSVTIRSDASEWLIVSQVSSGGGGGGWEVIETYDYDVDGGSISDIYYTSVLDGYSEIEIAFFEVSSSSDFVLQVNVGTGAGPTYAALGSLYGSTGASGIKLVNTTASGTSSTNVSRTTGSVDQAANRRLGGLFRLNCLDTDAMSSSELYLGYGDTSAASNMSLAFGGQDVGAIVTGIHIDISAGTIDSGIIQLRGRP